ncbi:RHS repeat domain-containing protein [Caulobacter endophyticus]|uniref:YD repeat-containing protein n=1 Tax=Caulobacter endophyticus TaxID=2172652 RepID=A0A2T9JNG1_9CAUL|nr:RHS repeat domain-containing protein [Caulobacter endophyticus]PVM85245.1 hypothetical protein DDF67_18115 [Caulobacter endophyticus]
MRTRISAALAALSLLLPATAAIAQTNERYTYDALGRLTAVDRSTGNGTVYEYDAAGNRTRVAPYQGYRNADFSAGLGDWQVATWQAPGHIVSVNNPGWHGNGNNVLWSYIPGQPSNALVDVRSGWTAVTPGRIYDVSVYAAEHRGKAHGLVEFYAADKATLISTVLMDGTARDGGAADGALANFNQLGAFVAAPAGAAYTRLNLRLASNGGEHPYAFFTRPALSIAVPQQEVVNPRFKYGNFGWSLALANTGPTAIGVNNPGWYGNGNDVLFLYVAGATTNGLMDLRSDFMPAEPGATYEASVAAAQHRGQAQLLIEFYAADKTTVLAQTALPGSAREGGASNGDIANFNILGGFVTAPAGAAYRRLNLRLHTTGGQDPHAFFTRPISRKATSGQQQLTTWSSLYGS